uniref:Uncharacterized protein n=1 Tax=Amphimedon queenslandica TaxID=400682 RepID=A0A1X7TK48_AMPQE
MKEFQHWRSARHSWTRRSRWFCFLGGVLKVSMTECIKVLPGNTTTAASDSCPAIRL